MVDSASPDWDQLARTCTTLSAFLSAGLAPSVAWRVVVDDRTRNSSEDEVSRDARGLSGGVMPADELVIAWHASVRVGAPLAVTCEYLADSFATLAQITRDVESATAAPIFASRIMVTLPFVGILLAAALGLNALAFLFTTPIGLLCLLAGLSLLCAAQWWSRRLVSRVNVRDVPRGTSTAVVAAALSVGVGLRVAHEAITAECDRLGVARLPLTNDAVSERSFEWGIPVAQLLLADARLARDRELSAVRTRAAELSERLLVPLGACVLPAFVLLSVVPIVVELVTHSGITWTR